MLWCRWIVQPGLCRKWTGGLFLLGHEYHCQDNGDRYANHKARDGKEDYDLKNPWHEHGVLHFCRSPWNIAR